MRSLEERQPSGSGKWDANAILLGESKIDPKLSRGLIVLYAAVGFVLLIACANLANLTTARMAGRQREIAVRTAIGAGRGALLRQVLVENVLLSVVGGMAGLLLAAWSMRLLTLIRPEADTGFWPTYMNQLDAQSMRVTWPVMAFSLVLSFAAGIFSALAPAIRASRGDVNAWLKGAAGASGGRHRPARLRGMLLAGQMALVVVLLVSAGLLMRSFFRLAAQPPGVETRNILTVPLTLPYAKYPAATARQFADRLLAQVRALPGVEAAAFSQDLPGLERSTVTVAEAVDSRPINEYIGWRSVDPGFFELFRIPIHAGRAFADRDRQGPPVAILNESAARALFPGTSPLGHHVKANHIDCEIIGVVPDVRYEKQKQQLAIVGDIFLAPARGGVQLIVRSAADPMRLLPAVRRIVAAIDPEIPVQGARTMEESLYLVHSYQRFSTLLLAVFAALALGLAMVGIYGVFSYAVAARTREFGIRLATGARGADILRLVLGEAALLSALGLAAGLPAALAAPRLLGSMVEESAAAPDPWTFAASAAVLVSTALAASYLPARRAARLDPLQSLRCD
jgi:putative ABC transport system permease protein